MDKHSLDSSENNSTVGNLSDFRIVPPHHMGRPKKGHLVFNANFECGNLGRVDYVSDCEYDLFIRPDTCNPKHRIWFYFSVSNVKAEQRVIFNFVNFSKYRSLYRHGMAPLVRSSSRSEWQRVPPKHVYYYKSPNHDDRYVMSFAFAFDREGDVYYFAYCFPYTYTQLQQFLDHCESQQYPYFQRKLLGLSVQKRRLDLITITDPANLQANSVQRIVFVTARVHPGETPSSFVCQGLISYLLSDSNHAKKLRERFVFKIVPMLNPDGVYLGNYRCSLMGFDLNRHWHSPSPWAHPSLYVTKNLLLQYHRDPRTRLELFFDLHAHSTCFNSFLYGNIFSNDAARCERQALIPSLLAEVADDFSMEQTQFNMDPIKAGTSRRTLGGELDTNSLCYTLEVSFFGYAKQSEPYVIIPYTEESCKLQKVLISSKEYFLDETLGKNLVHAIYKYLEIQETGKPFRTRNFHSIVNTAIRRLERNANASQERINQA